MTASLASRSAFCCLSAFSSSARLTPSTVPLLSSMIFAVTSSAAAPAFRPNSSQTALFATTFSGGCFSASLRLRFSARQTLSASTTCSSVASSLKPSSSASFLMSIECCPPSKLSELTMGFIPSIAGVLVSASEWSPTALLSALRTFTTGER